MKCFAFDVHIHLRMCFGVSFLLQIRLIKLDFEMHIYIQFHGNGEMDFFNSKPTLNVAYNFIQLIVPHFFFIHH